MKRYHVLHTVYIFPTKLLHKLNLTSASCSKGIIVTIYLSHATSDGSQVAIVIPFCEREELALGCCHCHKAQGVEFLIATSL